MEATPCGLRVAALIGLAVGKHGQPKSARAKISAGAETHLETQNCDGSNGSTRASAPGSKPQRPGAGPPPAGVVSSDAG
jgi:hypothetical protein